MTEPPDTELEAITREHHRKMDMARIMAFFRPRKPKVRRSPCEWCGSQLARKYTDPAGEPIWACDYCKMRLKMQGTELK